jgi:hypothetical protein
MEYFANVLHHDLNKETGSDSLIIVHYYYQRPVISSVLSSSNNISDCTTRTSKFSNLERNGIMKLTYDSIEGFHSALQQIILSEITRIMSNFQFLKMFKNLLQKFKTGFIFIKQLEKFKFGFIGFIVL